ncbi:hypothetical protein BDZ89DRAFT_1230938 [Hymenopellis radicata]|nr:hypothetical protein BDZ89DRAFT_1230938 [Hymenopellis radicata]
MSHHSSYSRSHNSGPPTILLYDTPGQTSLPWAPNIWRIRFILNYKRLRYRTVWVEFPQIEATLRAMNAPPSGTRANGTPIYTLPVIVDPTGHTPQIFSNPNTIAEYLETTYPARPVFPEGSRAMQTMFVHYIQEVFVRPLLPILVPLSHQNIPSHSGRPLRDGVDVNLEGAWREVKEQFDFLARVLDKNAGDGAGDGVVVMGAEVSYADFAVCAVLVWMERMVPREGWERVSEWNGGRWARLKGRCEPYMDVF